MNDRFVNALHVAHFVLHTASRADGGCLPCVQECVDEALHEHPELPWEEAALMIRPESKSRIMVEAVDASRRLLASEPVDSFSARVCNFQMKATVAAFAS
jgi:hypothetical protein